MKKITQCLLLLWGLTAFAQFPESFETTVPPTGWASFRGANGLGTGFDWTTTTVIANVQDGVQAAFVRYEDVVGGLAEDWLVSPIHTVTAPNTSLTFYQKQGFTTAYGTTYDIKVSTTSQTAIGSFTTVLSQTEADLNVTTMTQRSVDLSAFVGQSIYISFVMTNDDGDNWVIDNVNMESSVAAPSCAAVISPLDEATNVPVGIVTFAWNAPTTGGAATSYDFFYGLDPDDVTILLGNYTTTSIPVALADFNFTFYWKIVPKNAGGSAVDCPVWVFTTQEPPGFCLNAPNGQWPSGEEGYSPDACDGITDNVITESGFAGEFSLVNVIAGETYIFKSGTTDFITLSADAGATAAAFGATPLTWEATATGQVFFYSHTDDQCAVDDDSRTRSVTCGVVSTDFPDFINLQFPFDATIAQNGSAIIYAQIFESGLTDTTSGQAPGITAWIGVSSEGENTNPTTWTNWIPATFNVEVGNNDEYQAEIGEGLTPGTYYYASRFRLNNGDFAYGGSNNGFWDGTTHLSGVLTVTEAVFEGCLNAPNGLFPDETFVPACVGSGENINVFCYSGEYTNVDITAGTAYTFSSSIATDRVTIGNEDGTVVLAFGVTPLTWTSTVTGIVRFYLHDDGACSTSTAFRSRLVSCGAEPDAPANDNCADAIALTAGGVFADFPLNTTNFGATVVVTDPVPTCAAFNFEISGKDVWYSVAVPASGTLTIELQDDGGVEDTGMEVYTGSCAALTAVDCNDDFDGSFFSTIDLTDLAGQTVLVRVWGFNGTQGSFVISAYDGSLSSASFDNTNFTYYPNPVKDVLNVSYISNISKVSVINLLGQQMIYSEMNANQGQVDMSALATGTYLVKITTQDNLEKTIKVIKQ